MTQIPQTLKYFDLHLSGCGYLSRARIVRPKKGHPYWSVSIAACRGEASDKLKTYFDVSVVGEDAFNLIEQYADVINNRDQSVFVRFKVGDIYPETFVYGEGSKKKGETGVMLKGRLLKLPYLAIDGEEVYREQKSEPTAARPVMETGDNDEEYEALAAYDLCN